MQDVRQDLSPLLADLPREQRYLLPALQRVNAQLGYLPLWALEAVGEHLRVPRSEVHGVASHYPELRLAPGGRHLVRVCTGLSCQVVGGAAVQQALERALGLRAGQRREDGSLSFEPMACAFLCSVAPLVEVDHAAYGGLDPERAAALVRPLIERPA